MVAIINLVDGWYQFHSIGILNDLHGFIRIVDVVTAVIAATTTTTITIRVVIIIIIITAIPPPA